MKRFPPWLVVTVLILGVALVVWLNWPRAAFAYPTLAAKDLDGVTGTLDDNYRLRLHLNAIRFDGTRLKPWKELEEPGRSLWAVLSFENVVAAGGTVGAYRQMCREIADPVPLPAVSEGYRALGALRLAGWVEQAQRGAPGHDCIPADLLAEGRTAWVASVRRQSDRLLGK